MDRVSKFKRKFWIRVQLAMLVEFICLIFLIFLLNRLAGENYFAAGRGSGRTKASAWNDMVMVINSACFPA
jgi:hypothetical protein